ARSMPSQIITSDAALGLAIRACVSSIRAMRRWLVLLFAGFLFFAGCGALSPQGAPPATQPMGAKKEPPRRVIVVSVDGLMPDSYVHPDAHGLAVPSLRKIVKLGASSDGAMSVFPTTTYPAHTSIVTGVLPAKHGIFGNHPFEDAEAWRWYAEDITRD